eukprot:scaffold18160_cov56-Isochrysis_galbana.AAC.1
MPDKERYVQEMSRVLKPNGRIVIATWCEREEKPPFTPKVPRMPSTHPPPTEAAVHTKWCLAAQPLHARVSGLSSGGVPLKTG